MEICMLNLSYSMLKECFTNILKYIKILKINVSDDYNVTFYESNLYNGYENVCHATNQLYRYKLREMIIF